MKTMSIGSIGLACLLGGCVSLASPEPASPYYAYPSGWGLRLNRALTIPGDAATVRVQYGRVVPRNGVQEHDAYCVIEVNTVRPEPRNLEPGRFEVRRVTRSVETVALMRSPLLKASLVRDDGGPSFLYYKTTFHLVDPARPDLRSMTCGWDQMAPGNRGMMRHLTVDEIRAALGNWLTLIPPATSL